MKIKLTKDYRVVNYDKCKYSKKVYSTGEVTSFDDEDAQWLIDNGFAEEVKESGWWKPEEDDTYYYVRDTMGMFSRDEVARQSWDYDEDDEYRYSIGNVFKTEKSARRFIEYLKAVETVRHDEGFMKYDKTYGEVWELRRAYLDSEKFFTARQIEYEGLHYLGAFYFDTEAHAIASVDKHPNEWETILNYDWGKGE